MARVEGHETRQGSTPMEEIKEQARSGAAVARREARARAEHWTVRLGERTGDLSGAARSAAETLRGKEDWLADAAEALARNLEQVSISVREKGFEGLRTDLEKVARERPALFMGAAVLTGVAIGRLLRSTTRGAGDGSPQSHHAQSPTAGTTIAPGAPGGALRSTGPGQSSGPAAPALYGTTEDERRQ